MKLGVLGGTFNPIHLGHLHIASETARLFKLSQVHFVVATLPPHKASQTLIPFVDRYVMVCLATAGIPKFIPSAVELEQPPSPFSIDTMAKLARRHALAGEALYFIAGGDSLLDVATWRKSEELLLRYNFVFVMRPNAEIQDVSRVLPRATAGRICDLTGLSGPRRNARIRAEASQGRSKIFIVDLGAPDISGSGIRELTARGKKVQKLVPPLVREYVGKLRLYGEQ